MKTALIISDLHATITLFTSPLLPLLTYSQQQFKGSVKDLDTELGLEGVNVILLDENNQYTPNGVITDAEGKFSMENVPLGRQSFEIRYLGYKTKILPALIIQAGKVPVVEMFLKKIWNN